MFSDDSTSPKLISGSCGSKTDYSTGDFVIDNSNTITDIGTKFSRYFTTVISVSPKLAQAIHPLDFGKVFSSKR